MQPPPSSNIPLTRLELNFACEKLKGEYNVNFIFWRTIFIFRKTWILSQSQIHKSLSF